MKLYSYQEEDVRRMQRQPYFLNANEMGLGKTVEALEEIRRSGIEPLKVLIICPNSVKSVWEDHIEELFPWSPPIIALSGKTKDGFRGFEQGFCIVNSEALRLIPDFRLHLWDFVIVDECHHFKNRKAQRTKALKKIRAKHKRALSGTPMVNRPDELWSILNWLDRKTYCNTGEAPVWMGDGTFKRLDEIQVGDVIVGWQRGARNSRQLVPTRVTHIDSYTRPVVKVAMKSGNIIRCTQDHKWLRGSGSGNKVGMGFNPEVGTEDWFLPIEDWQGGLSGKTRNGHPKQLSLAVTPPRELSPYEKHLALWLGGIFDGEGTWPSIAQSKTHNPEVCERIELALNILGFQWSYKGGMTYRIKSYSTSDGTPKNHHSMMRQVATNFINWCEPVKRDRILFGRSLSTSETKTLAVFGYKWRIPDEIVSIELDGLDTVYGMETETGNYFAWGYASQNSSYWRFFDSYVTSVDSGYGYRIVTGPKNAEGLNAELTPFMARKLKRNVLKDLPDKYYTYVKLDMTAKQAKAYHEMKKDSLAWLESLDGDQPLPAPTVLAQLTRLRQFATAYCELEFADIVRMTEPSNKLDALIEIIEDTDEPIVVFSQFKQTIYLAEARLQSIGIMPALLTGDTPQEIRGESIERFQNGDYQVLLATVQTGGMGITLHRASTCVFLDRSWSPAYNLQAEDRLHRIGQDEAVQVIVLQSKGTVDLTVETRLERKASWLRKIIDGDNLG